MPWRPLLEIYREFERLPVRLNPAATKELKLFFANRLNLAVGQISDDDISTVTKFATLQSPEVVMVHAAREIKWLASGRRSADRNREVIHPDHWAFLTLDIEHQAARDLNGKVVYADLKGAFGNDLTEKEWQEVELELTPPKPTTRVGHEPQGTVKIAVPEEPEDKITQGDTRETEHDALRLDVTQPLAPVNAETTDIEAEYTQRVKDHRVKTGRRPTYEADNEWRKSKGLKRDALRDLRQKNRTDEEKKGGHPPHS